MYACRIYVHTTHEVVRCTKKHASAQLLMLSAQLYSITAQFNKLSAQLTYVTAQINQNVITKLCSNLKKVMRLLK